MAPVGNKSTIKKPPFIPLLAPALFVPNLQTIGAIKLSLGTSAAQHLTIQTFVLFVSFCERFCAPPRRPLPSVKS